MKPTSPLLLFLFLFLGLATAAPIPSKSPKGCLHYTTCQPWLREIFSSPNSNTKSDHTPPTRLTTPHFPAHQLYLSSSPESHRQIEEESFNNSSLKPPKDQKPSPALSANRPLQSSYLLSLANPSLQNPPQSEPQSTFTTDALPSKPTSTLPQLRKEDALRYRATITSDSLITIDEKEGEDMVTSYGPVSTTPKCRDYSKLAESAYLRVGQPMIMAREYSDLLVVAIVVLFLAALVVLEAVRYIGDL